MFQVSLTKWSDLQGKSATCGRLNSLRTALDIASGGEQGTAEDPGLPGSAVVYPGLPWSTWSALPWSALVCPALLRPGLPWSALVDLVCPALVCPGPP